MKHLPVAIALVIGIVLGVAGYRLVPHHEPTAAMPVAQAPAAPPALAPVAAPGAEDPRAVYKVPLLDSPARGPKDALVTIVGSTDFECPFCKKVQPTLKQVAETYGSRVRFVFKHNPLSIHPSSIVAARIAEVARAEGGDARFWEFHDKVFELPALDTAALEKAGREVGLSAESIQKGLTTPDIERIRRDQNLVNALGARGTPTFFVNGRKLVGAQPLEAFKALVDEELAKAQALVKSGVAATDIYAKIIDKGATAPVIIPGGGGAQVAAQAVVVPLRPDDPVRGPRVAPVTLVLFSDFQCPFCGKVEPTIAQIRKEYGDNVRVAWKHLPLPFHPNALPAAKVAEGARAAGKFWEMHDSLFANQQSLSDATYAALARDLHLDAKRFQRDAASGAAAARIAEDQQLAARVGATGTPTLFVNCRRLVGAQPFQAFKQLIDEELKKADGMKAKGEKLDAGFYDRICAANVTGQLAAR
jgi:protein-disulfide isomerase